MSYCIALCTFTVTNAFMEQSLSNFIDKEPEAQKI